MANDTGIFIDGFCYSTPALATTAYKNLIATYPPIINSGIDSLQTQVFGDGSAWYTVIDFNTGLETTYNSQFSLCTQTSIQQPISDIIFVSAVVICALLGLIAGQQR